MDHEYVLHPTKDQEVRLAKTFGCCRKFHNELCELLGKEFDRTGKVLEFYDMLPTLIQNMPEYYKEVDPMALLYTATIIIGRFKLHSHGCSRPRFESAKHSHQTYSTFNTGGSISIRDNYILLPCIGKVDMDLNGKERPVDRAIGSVYVYRNKDKSYGVWVRYLTTEAEWAEYGIK